MSPAVRTQIVALLIASVRRAEISDALSVLQSDVDHIYATLSYIDARSVAFAVTTRRGAWPTEAEAFRFVDRFDRSLHPEVVVADAHGAALRAQRLVAATLGRVSQ